MMQHYYTYDLTPGLMQIYQDQISESEYLSICAHLKYLSLVRAGIDHFQIICVGIDSFERFAPTVLGHEDRFLFLDYYFSAWLNAFYSWIQFFEKNFAKEFNSLKSSYYDNHREYRLAYNLRMAETHSANVINKLNHDILSQETHVCIGIDELLLSKEHMQKSFIPELIELKRQQKDLDAIEISVKMREILTSFQNSLFSSIKQKVQESLRIVLSVLPDEPQRLYNTDLESTDKTIHIQLGAQMCHIIKKMLRIYPAFLENTIYYNTGGKS